MAGPHDKSLESFFKTADFLKVEFFEGADIEGLNDIMVFYYDYWENKCTNKKIPARQDIRPDELRKYLPYAALFDIFNKPGPFYQDFRLQARLIGTHVAKGFGEIAGRDAAEIPHPETAKRVYALPRFVWEKTRARIKPGARLRAGTRTHRAPLYLPLSETGTDVDKILVGAEGRMAADTT